MGYDLGSLKDDPVVLPPRILIYGEQKIGKTTFCSQAPSPIILAAEEGAELLTIKKPVVNSISDLLGWLGALYSDDHEHKTVVIDSITSVEQLIFAEVCKDNKKNNIEEIGYAKGYTFALEYWKTLLSALDDLRKEKNVMPILIAHEVVKRFDDPLTESYDRYQIDVHQKAASLVSRWVDIIGFACQAYNTEEEDQGFNKTRTRAKSLGSRVLKFEAGPACRSGSRYALPSQIPLDWDIFYSELQTSIKNTIGEK